MLLGELSTGATPACVHMACSVIIAGALDEGTGVTQIACLHMACSVILADALEEDTDVTQIACVTCSVIADLMHSKRTLPLMRTTFVAVTVFTCFLCVHAFELSAEWSYTYVFVCKWWACHVCVQHNTHLPCAVQAVPQM